MKIRPRNRQRRCYELTYLYICTDERYDDGSWSLVQGEITISRVPFGHAWLVSDDGRVYDPVHNKTYTVADYEAKFKANSLKTYSQKEASRTGAELGHYGPWVWSPRMLGGALPH